MPRLLLALAAAFVLAAPARGQLPQARLDRIVPLGGSAGGTVELTIQGKDLEDVAALRFDRPGFKAERIRPNVFRVSVPTDAATGTVEVRAVGQYGVSGSRLFAVNRGLAEVLEKEPNDTAATAQKVPLDCAVNGTSDNEGDDYFTFRAKKGQRVVLDCQALRLDSTMRPSLVLSDAKGKELARSRPYFLRTDPLLDFVAPEDGDYVVGLHDATYAGGQPYRLLISTRPHVEGVFPQAVRPGETAKLTVYGRNLLGGKPAAGGLEALTLNYTAPKAPGLDYFFHPSASAVKRHGWQWLPRELENATSAATVVAADAPVALEREPNDAAGKAQELALPAVVCGRFDRPGDADWYAFTAKAGERIRVDLMCERTDTPGDPFVLVENEKGQEVAQFDDHGISFNALALYNRDPSGTFGVPAAGKYRVLVQERYGNGGARYSYVLRLVRAEPDFFPVAFHATNPDPTSPLVRAGGSAHLEVCLNRRDLPGPVVIEAKGLPEGVTCPPVHISPQTEMGNVVFTAAPGAKEWSGAIRLVATATAGGKKLTRELRCVQRRWAVANINTSRVCREICLAVRPGAPYGLALQEKAALAAGTSGEVEVRLKRHGDFAGKVQVSGLNLPPGFAAAATEIPAGKQSAKVKLSVAPNVPPGTYTLVVKGDAQVPFSRDPKAKGRPNVRVADASTPLTLTVMKKK